MSDYVCLGKKEGKKGGVGWRGGAKRVSSEEVGKRENEGVRKRNGRTVNFFGGENKGLR